MGLSKNKEKPLNVKFVKWGFANRYDDNEICVNRNFKKYPHLLRQILKHETEHDEGKNTKHDVIHDLTINSQIPFYDQFLFMVRSPTTFAQILPIRYSKQRGIIYDVNGLMWWAFIGIGVFVGLKLL